MKRVRLLLALAFLALLPGQASAITVFAAASLADALKEVAAQFEKAGGPHVVLSFAASSALARQIEASSGADLFISADRDWMDYLDKKGLIARREDLLGNRLVLIAPRDSSTALSIAPHFGLAEALGGGRLALANPDAVPAGRYAKAALTRLGVWDGVADHLAEAEDVRVALAYVARGEAPLGIVYRTDAKAEPRVRIVDTFPEATHPPILYPAGLIKDAQPQALRFFEYLTSPSARLLFEKSGFAFLAK